MKSETIEITNPRLLITLSAELVDFSYEITSQTEDRMDGILRAKFKLEKHSQATGYFDSEIIVSRSAVPYRAIQKEIIQMKKELTALPKELF